MRIKKIHIQNFKSLVDFQLEDLKPFCAFLGPNASGKSNIFEALEFTNNILRYKFTASDFFGGKKNIFSFNSQKILNENFDVQKHQSFNYQFQDTVYISFFLEYERRSEQLSQIDFLEDDEGIITLDSVMDINKRKEFIATLEKGNNVYEGDYEQFIDNFSRIFVGNSKLVRINQPSPSSKLLSDGSNLSQIIGQIFQDENKREDFIEWLQILIPEFQNIEVKQSNIDGSFEFFIYEKSSNKPFPKYLISDGTYNILALMAAVYQNSQPQFLCIEEPENGLHPEAIELLVDFFKEKCEQEGHHIWLNTHSATLVRCLEIDEIILVNKINGETKARQLIKNDNVNIKTDEAWLSNALGGGVSWSR